MFLQKLAKTSAARLSIRQATKIHRPFLFHARTFVTLPDTKEADDILPIINTIETKTTDNFNSILTQLAKEGRSLQAQTLYDRIFRHHEVVADMTTYSQLMLAYLNDGKYEDAMEIYYQLRDHEATTLRLDASTYATMIESLTDSKNVNENRHMFDPTVEPLYYYSVEDTPSYIYPDIDGESQPSLLTALTLFNDMRQLDIQPTSDMYVHMLKACAEQRDGYVLDKVHKLIRMDVYLDPSVAVSNHLMKAYQAVGDGPTVLELWDIAESFDKESISIVLKTCVDHGYHSRADAIWDASQQNLDIYLKSVLDRGDVERAKQLIQEHGDETSRKLLENYVQ